MIRAFLLVFLTVTGFSAVAQGATETGDPARADIIMPGDSVDLNELLWIKRPLVVFADSPADPRYVQQIDFLTERLEDLAVRDVVVLTVHTPME